MDRKLTRPRPRPSALLACAAVAAGAAGVAACYLPYPVPAGSVGEAPAPGPARPDPEWGGTGCAASPRQEALERVNALRRERGLEALRPHAELVRAAQGHTEYQADRDRITHTGADGSAPADRVEREGYRFASVGENVAGGYAGAAAVVDGWMGSRGHRAILLTPGATHVGIGYAYRAEGRLHHFWTLVAASPGPGEETSALRCHP